MKIGELFEKTEIAALPLVPRNDRKANVFAHLAFDRQVPSKPRLVGGDEAAQFKI